MWLKDQDSGASCTKISRIGWRTSTADYYESHVSRTQGSRARRDSRATGVIRVEGEEVEPQAKRASRRRGTRAQSEAYDPNLK